MINILVQDQEKSQLGALVSEQSKAIDLHFDFTAEMQKISSQFEGKSVERPKHWGGYKVNPLSIEFWQGQPLVFIKESNIVFVRISGK